MSNKRHSTFRIEEGYEKSPTKKFFLGKVFITLINDQEIENLKKRIDNATRWKRI